MKKIHTPIIQGSLLIFFLGYVFLPSAAKAEIKDYMIRRMIILKTECKLDELKRSEPSEGGFKYLAICENVSFYPDGVTINCSDKDVETSCKIKTKAKKFDKLNLLKNSVNNKHDEGEEK